ncbi:hypothetical protein [Methanobrevibacter cuticularis]|uniref:hypothetical protein n=1 Tax=Methanobrevibacter cuticularis TaxID=47311 RepID=UPI001471BDDD|nr:hypothetical protein [Methanobrevibacter cuticularis]
MENFVPIMKILGTFYKKIKDKTDYLFTNKYGKPLSIRVIENLVKMGNKNR